MVQTLHQPRRGTRDARDSIERVALRYYGGFKQAMEPDFAECQKRILALASLLHRCRDQSLNP